MAIIKSNNPRKGIRYKPWVRDLDGQWMRSHTWDKKTDADKEERELLSSREKGAYRQNRYAPLPFVEAAEKWLKDIEQRRCSMAHIYKTRHNVERYLTPCLEHLDLKQITPSDISALVNKLANENVKPLTINGALCDLRALFNFHIEEENVDSNPVKKKHKMRILDDSPEVVWTPDEAQKFLDQACKTHLGERRWPYLIYKIALNTGMRYGEIIALERSDFDFVNSKVKISKSYDLKAHIVKMPKSGKVRFAPLPKELADEVESYCAINKIFRELFVDKSGQYRSYSTFRNIHYFKDIARAGVRKTKFHNSRRFFIKHYIERGGNEAQLRKIVGHACQRMTDWYNTQDENMTPLADVVSI